MGKTTMSFVGMLVAALIQLVVVAIFDGEISPLFFVAESILWLTLIRFDFFRGAFIQTTIIYLFMFFGDMHLTVKGTLSAVLIYIGFILLGMLAHHYMSKPTNDKIVAEVNVTIADESRSYKVRSGESVVLKTHVSCHYCGKVYPSGTLYCEKGCGASIPQD